ncbi:MAG: hypothetical protein CMN76_17740 [Spirochaetaceae bacterium]|nr:hypothetical protein [Spirochaetaceae bacterium]
MDWNSGPSGPSLQIAGHTIHSTRAPEKEGQRFIDGLFKKLHAAAESSPAQIESESTAFKKGSESHIPTPEPKNRQNVLICGIGDGFLLKPLLDALESGDHSARSLQFYLYEPCNALRENPSPGVKEAAKHPAIQWIEDSHWNPPARFQFFILPSYQRNFPELQRAFRPDTNANTVEKWMRRWRRNFSIRRGQERVYARMPAQTSFVFLGASPALEDELEWPALKEYRDRYLLVCSDTALSQALRHGLVPDLVLCVDCAPATAYHLLQARNNQRLLLKKNEITSHPAEDAETKADPANSASSTGKSASAEKAKANKPEEESFDGTNKPGTEESAASIELPTIQALTYSAGPLFVRDFFGSEWLYESDFPDEQSEKPETGKWQSISNPTGNLSGLAIALAGSNKDNDLILLGSDAEGSIFQSHCRNTGYEYYGLLVQNRLNPLDQYYFRLGSRHYSRKLSAHKVRQKQTDAANILGLKLYRGKDPAWLAAMKEKPTLSSHWSVRRMSAS